MLKKYFYRILYRSEGQKVPFLIYPFLLMTLTPGIFYTFLAQTDSVQASVLYGLTSVRLGEAGVSLWGVLCIVAVVLSLVNILFRKKWAGRTAPLLGFLVWLYAIIIFLMGGYWYQLLGFALPQLVFWIWHYIRVEDYWRNVDRGSEVLI